MKDNKTLKYLDKKFSKEERKKEYKKVMDKRMNPIPKDKFNPKTFEPLGDENGMFEIAGRKRIKPPKKLPTANLEPKEIREGQMIGMTETKGDIYLTFAHRCNDLQVEVDTLRDEVKILKKLIEKKYEKK